MMSELLMTETLSCATLLANLVVLVAYRLDPVASHPAFAHTAVCIGPWKR